MSISALAHIADPALLAWIRVQGAGPPRAVGAAQARAWLDARIERDETPIESLRRAAQWVLRWGGHSLSSPLTWEQRQALVRDLRRHFPHFAERAEALARVAGCGPVWVATADAASRAFSLEVDSGHGAALHCRLPGTKRWALREIASDGGYRSCGVSVPWLPANLAGVNEAGLCGAVMVDSPLLPSGAAPGSPGAGSLPEVMAPGWLLLDQCLERCDRVERALAWCQRRPGGGHARLIFADARGERAQLAIEGTTRRVSAPESSAARDVAARDIRLDPLARTLELGSPEAGRVVLSCASSSAELGAG